MMLYVFYMDKGVMVMYDMAYTQRTVEELQERIWKDYRIPVEHQVLLMSGGVVLAPTEKVSYYNVGTESNPIFLFRKPKSDINQASTVEMHELSDDRLQDELDNALLLPVSFDTVQNRANLAQSFEKTALSEVKIAELLLHEHHLCHQGFGAVIANLEELEGMLKRHAENFIQVFDKYVSERSSHYQTLERVKNALIILQKIPFLSCLGQSEEQQRVWDSQTQGRMPENLFQWIDWQLRSSVGSLVDMLDQCRSLLEELTESKKGSILNEQQQIEQTTSCKKGQDLKVMNGLEERLIALETKIRDMRIRCHDQTTLRESFESNLNRVVSTKDPSVLPDLCHSHKSQLTQMSKVHKAITDNTNKIRSSKQDMCNNINFRLRWVMSVEQRIQMLYTAVFVTLENIHKLERRLQLMEQVITAPVAFARIVIECHRRRCFASKFTEWAGDLSAVSSTTITAETERREKFSEEIGNHFITALFPGLTDVPPRYSATAPEPFDHLLPPITEEHLQQLAAAIPEFSEILNTPLDLSGIESLLAFAPCKKCNLEQLEISPLFSMAAQGSTSSPATLIPSAVTCSYPDLPPLSGSFPTQERQEGEGGTARLLPTAPRVGEGVEVLQSLREKSKSQDGVRSQELLSAHRVPGKGSPPHQAPPAEPEAGGPDKSKLETRLAEELQSCQGRLTSLQTQYSALQSKVQSVLSDWRESQQGLKSSVQDDLRVMSDIISLYQSQIQCCFNDVRTEMSRQEAERMAEMESKMAAQEMEIQQLQNRVAETQSQYETFRAESERKTEIEKALQEELRQTRENQVEKERELVTKHSLELELEREKLMHDHQTQVTALENQHSMQARQLELLQEDKDRLEEEMQTLRKALQMAEHTLGLRRKGEDENAELREALEQATQQMQQEKARLEDQHRQVVTKIQEELQSQKEEAERKQKEMEAEHQKTLQAKDALMEERLAEAQKALQEREEQLRKEQAEEQGRLQQEKELRLQELQTAIGELKEQIKEIQMELEARQRQLDEEEKRHQVEVGSLKEELQGERIAAEAQTSLQTELAELRARLAEMEAAQTVSSTPLMAAEPDPASQSDAVTQAVEEALEMAQKQHQTEMENLQGRLIQEHEKAIDELKLSFQADRQAHFNMAIQKVIQDKEKQLEEVRGKERSTAAELESLMQKLQVVEMEKSKAEDVKERALNLLQEKERQFSEEKRLLEEEKRRLDEERNSLQQSLMQSQMEGMAQSQISLIQQSAMGPIEGDAETAGKIQHLQQSMRMKDEEVSKLQKQLMGTSITSGATAGTTAVTQTPEKPKVSILSPDAGSLVLLCYEENYRQYIAFTVGNVCFFVHSESLADLGLTLDPTYQNRKKWVLAEVTDKEYCQAKKPNNRFNVPVGTKFYRIRAKPWKLEGKSHQSKLSTSSH